LFHRIKRGPQYELRLAGFDQSWTVSPKPDQSNPHRPPVPSSLSIRCPKKGGMHGQVACCHQINYFKVFDCPAMPHQVQQEPVVSLDAIAATSGLA
jgi:hypothetical protein